MYVYVCIYIHTYTYIVYYTLTSSAARGELPEVHAHPLPPRRGPQGGNTANLRTTCVYIYIYIYIYVFVYFLLIIISGSSSSSSSSSRVYYLALWISEGLTQA